MEFAKSRSFHWIAAIVFLCTLVLSTSMAFANELSQINETAPLGQEAQSPTDSQLIQTESTSHTADVDQDARAHDQRSIDASSNDVRMPSDMESEADDAIMMAASNEESPDEQPLEAMATSQEATVNMYRLYNPNSGEHFYTSSIHERDCLDGIGWIFEGIGWIAPVYSSSPVYRLYNPNSGDHHYTLSVDERDGLDRIGWIYEGIGWYSDEQKRVPLYRQFNPNETIGTHNYTSSEREDKKLGEIGWVREGVAWYGAAAATPSFNSYIYLDAGHGMGSSSDGVYDSGACGSGYEEAKLTAELVNMTAQYARNLYGLNVYTNVNTCVQFRNRQADAKARGCTSFVSIHFNSYNGGATGIESYIHSRNAAARSSELQSIMHGHLVDALGLRDRGKKSAALAVCSGANTGIPATLLEVCFIDNGYDMRIYQERKDAVARQLAAGLYEAARNGF